MYIDIHVYISSQYQCVHHSHDMWYSLSTCTSVSMCTSIHNIHEYTILTISIGIHVYIKSVHNIHAYIILMISTYTPNWRYTLAQYPQLLTYTTVPIHHNSNTYMDSKKNQTWFFDISLTTQEERICIQRRHWCLRIQTVNFSIAFEHFRFEHLF